MTHQSVLYATESVVDVAPLTVQRTARWAECAPAGVVYTGKFSEYMLNAVSLFRSLVLGSPLGSTAEHQSFGTPAKAMEMIFHSSLWPDDEFTMKDYVGKIGNKTMHLLVDAVRLDNAKPVFCGRLSSIFINRDDRSRLIPVPDHMVTALEGYQMECGRAPEDLLGLLP